MASPFKYHKLPILVLIVDSHLILDGPFSGQNWFITKMAHFLKVVSNLCKLANLAELQNFKSKKSNWQTLLIQVHIIKSNNTILCNLIRMN